MFVLLYAIRLNIAHKNNIKNQIQICRSNKTNKEIKKSFDIPTKSKKYILSNMKFYCIKETEKKKNGWKYYEKETENDLVHTRYSWYKETTKNV